MQVASAGLKPSRHLGKSLSELLPHFKACGAEDVGKGLPLGFEFRLTGRGMTWRLRRC